MWLLDALNLTLIMFGSEFGLIGSIGEFVLICFETLALNILTLKRDRLPRRLVTFRLKIVGKLHNGWWLCDVLCLALRDTDSVTQLEMICSELRAATWKELGNSMPCAILPLWLLLASSTPLSKSSLLQIETSFNIPTVGNSGVWRFLFHKSSWLAWFAAALTSKDAGPTRLSSGVWMHCGICLLASRGIAFCCWFQVWDLTRHLHVNLCELIYFNQKLFY